MSIRAPISDILAICESEVDLSRGYLILRDHFEEHVRVWDHFNPFSTFWLQDLAVTIFVSYEALELVVKCVAFHIEISHHRAAIDAFGVLKLVDTLLLGSSHLIGTLYLILHLVVLLVSVR